MTVKNYRKKPVEIEALQWDDSHDRADLLWEWTAKASAIGNAWPTHFMVLGEDDAYEVFNCYDDDMEVVPGNEVERRMSEGYTAVIYDTLHGTWVNVSTGDWIIRGVQGEFYPCRPDVFADTYDEIPA